MDGTFVEVPVQRNTREQNAQIKNGVVPAEFIAEPHAGSHKDTDARHAKKGDENHFGYKNHMLVDAETKYVLDYADSAYVGSERNPIQPYLEERGLTMQVCEKGYRNNPLTFLQRFCNNVKSLVRCRVEHILGMQKKRMGDETLRTIGIQRANFWIGMRNLTNNMCRRVCLTGAK
jgi:IS5 family transposase